MYSWMNMKQKAFSILIALCVAVVVGGIIVLVTIIIPRRRPGGQNACINNLRMIDSGKEQAALAEHWSDTQRVDALIVNQYIKGNTTPLCPGRGHYIYGRMNENPQCTFQGGTTHKLPVTR